MGPYIRDYTYDAAEVEELGRDLSVDTAAEILVADGPARRRVVEPNIAEHDSGSDDSFEPVEETEDSETL